MAAAQGLSGGSAEPAALAVLGPAPPDRGGIAHETALLVEELSRVTAVSYWTFSRPYPRWLDPRRFAIDPSLSRPAVFESLDYLSPRSWGATADRIAASGAQALLVPWWTSFWALPIRAVFRRLATRRPDASRILLCHNLQDHERSLWKRFLSHGAFDAASAFVVHGADDHVELERRFPGRPAATIPLPAPLLAVGREEARRALNVQGRLVLFLGLVRQYKGLDILLHAAPRIVAQTGASIAVVGEVFEDAGPVQKLKDSSPARDRIVWRDRYVSEEEMEQWLAACDVLALPYRRISSSAIAARGIGAQRPLAASRVGGLKDVVVPGVTGELFEPEDAEGLAAAVERIFERGTESYRAGLESAARRMSWKNYASDILDFVETIGGSTPVRKP